MIYLMRHAETSGDIDQRYGGDFEDALTAKGRKQVKSAARFFKDKNIGTIICSPRIRARQSAQIVANKVGLPLKVVESWRERNFYGILTGMKKSDAAQKYPELVEKAKSYKNTLPKGDQYANFRNRILRVLEQVQKISGNVVVLTHGGPITCIGREIFGKEFKVHDCGILAIKNESEKLTIDSFQNIDIKS